MRLFAKRSNGHTAETQADKEAPCLETETMSHSSSSATVAKALVLLVCGGWLPGTQMFVLRSLRARANLPAALDHSLSCSREWCAIQEGKHHSFSLLNNIDIRDRETNMGRLDLAALPSYESSHGW